MPDLTDRYCVFWEDQHTARIRKHDSHLAAARAQPWSSIDHRNDPPLAWLRIDPETQDVHVYASAVEVRDRRWIATLDTIQDAVNLCHAVRVSLDVIEQASDEIAAERRGYHRKMPFLEWAPYEIYEVTWHDQRDQADEASPL
ncbi:MAG: hypothetical protein JSS74_04200 [Actinobacteria bacterium]|nr:hypothetical protein [Actinomycetota bacterium]